MKIHRIILTTLFYVGISQTAFSQSIAVKVLDDKGNLLPDMVVYLQPPEGMTVGITDKTIEVAQVDKSFSPYLGVMQKGSNVKFNNQDNISHHIYSPVGENKFAFKIDAGEQIIKKGFDTSGTVAMGCNIHDWMSGHLLIVETPYFAKTNNDGIANISVKEKGKYNVVVWHPQMTTESNRISKELNANNQSAIEIKLSQPLAPLPSQKNDSDFDFLSDY